MQRGAKDIIVNGVELTIVPESVMKDSLKDTYFDFKPEMYVRLGYKRYLFVQEESWIPNLFRAAGYRKIPRKPTLAQKDEMLSKLRQIINKRLRK